MKVHFHAHKRLLILPVLSQMFPSSSESYKCLTIARTEMLSTVQQLRLKSYNLWEIRSASIFRRNGETG